MKDLDGDGVPEYLEDADGDGQSDWAEKMAASAHADKDGDGFPSL